MQDEFGQQFASAAMQEEAVKMSKRQKLAGTPIFTEPDILATSYPLAKLLRMILVYNGVTKEMYVRKHKEYAERCRMSGPDANSNRNNIWRAMQRPKVTYDHFELVVCVIMGLNLVDLRMDLRDSNTGEIKHYRLSDAEMVATGSMNK